VADLIRNVDGIARLLLAGATQFEKELAALDENGIVNRVMAVITVPESHLRYAE
jgi:hypothetical protein